MYTFANIGVALWIVHKIWYISYNRISFICFAQYPFSGIISIFSLLVFTAIFKEQQILHILIAILYMYNIMYSKSVLTVSAQSLKLQIMHKKIALFYIVSWWHCKIFSFVIMREIHFRIFKRVYSFCKNLSFLIHEHINLYDLERYRLWSCLTNHM